MKKWPFRPRNQATALAGQTTSAQPTTSPIPPADSPRFANVSAYELARLDELATLIEIKAGATLVHEGGLGEQCVVVLEGALNVRRDGEIVADIAPGYFGGEMSMYLEQRCNADVVAARDSLVYVLDRGDFQNLMVTCPEIRQQVTATMSARLAR